MQAMMLVFLATLLAVFQLGLARAAESEPLRLADVLAAAREHNPELRAARERARAAAAIPRQVAALDDPTLAWESWNVPNSLRVNRADNNIFRLSQKLPFPGKRGLAGKVAEREATVVERDADSVELDVLAEVKRTYYDLWQAHQNLLIYQRERALLERFARTAERRYGTGDVPQTDVLRAQVELTRTVNRVTTETLAIASARAELNALLSQEPSEPLGVPEEAPLPELDDTPAALVTLALERRPELAAQAAAVSREETAIRLARRNYWPDFEVSVGRFVNYDTDDGFGAMASVTIPLAYRSKYEAAVAEARARLSAAQADLRRVQDRVRREVEQAFLRARTARLQHDLFVTTHIPQTEQTLRVSESAYETGAVDFLTLIDTVRAIEAVHLEHIEAASALEKAYADIERAVGVDFRHGAAH
jgi:outer membrane protein TolC